MEFQGFNFVSLLIPFLRDFRVIKVTHFLSRKKVGRIMAYYMSEHTVIIYSWLILRSSIFSLMMQRCFTKFIDTYDKAVKKLEKYIKNKPIDSSDCDIPRRRQESNSQLKRLR